MIFSVCLEDFRHEVQIMKEKKLNCIGSKFIFDVLKLFFLSASNKGCNINLFGASARQSRFITYKFIFSLSVYGV